MTYLLIYLLILLTVFLFQRKLLYFPAQFSQKDYVLLMTEFSLKPWPSLNDLRGLMAISTPDEVKGTVLVFHGNAGAALHRTYYIEALQRLGYRVIIAEYPGYGYRNGSPSEKRLNEDGIATATKVWDEFKEPLFLCGESLGNGVVAGIVASNQVPVKGLLLITPFDSMTEIAKQHYWYFLAHWLILDRYDNVSKLRNYKGPIAVIMAEKDEIIPIRRTLALFDALSGSKKLWRFERAGHNSLPLEPMSPWWGEAMAFIDN